MAFQKIGLIFSGGGGRGAYQIGVWRALQHLGLDRNVHAIAGTSIGALNAALFLQGDIDAAVKAWLSIRPDQILSLKGFNERRVPKRWQPLLKRLPLTGLFSRDGLNELLDTYVNLQLVSDSPTESWVTCRNTSTGKAQYFPLRGEHPERIRSYLLASSAIPFLFEPETIDGVAYVDGGIGIASDVTPVTPVYKYGCDLIIVVYTERTQIVDGAKFPHSRIVEIVPQASQGRLMGTFDFTSDGARRRMQQGYEDAMRIVEPVHAMARTQVGIAGRLQQMREAEASFQKQRAQIRADRSASLDEIHGLLEDNQQPRAHRLLRVD